MKLRLLQQKDAAGMLEWMHDEEVNKYFRFRAGDMSERKPGVYHEVSVGRRGKEKFSFCNHGR